VQHRASSRGLLEDYCTAKRFSSWFTIGKRLTTPLDMFD